MKRFVLIAALGASLIALVKPPAGFKPCGVSFPTTGGTATYIAIECTKIASTETVMTFTRM